MCQKFKNTILCPGAGKKSAAIRYTAMALLACVLSLSILSGILLITHADHDHDHLGPDGTCATCAQIFSAASILKQLSTVLAVTAVAAVLAYALIPWLWALPIAPPLFTLVGLKVRLNN